MTNIITERTTELAIEGATCGGCVKSIEKAIGQVTGVESVSFSLESKVAVVVGTADPKVIETAIEDAGFDVIRESNTQILRFHVAYDPTIEFTMN